MATLGNKPQFGTYGFTRTQAESFNGDGSTLSFTMGHYVKNAQDIEVLVDNVQQSPFDGSYSVNGTTLTFSGAPSVGTNNIYIVYRQAGTTLDTQTLVPDDNSVTYAKLGTDIPLGNRNLISNGNFQIAQRGTTFTNAAGSTYKLDRWRDYIGEGTWTVSQHSDGPAGHTQCLRYEVTSAVGTPNSAVHITTSIEGLNTTHLKWGTSNAESLTLSFWVKGSITGRYNVEIDTYDPSSTTYTNIQYFNINTADTWEYKTILIPGRTAQGLRATSERSIGINWWISAAGQFVTSADDPSDDGWASGGYPNGQRGYGMSAMSGTAGSYIQLAGVQLEVGTKATQFEFKPYANEEQECFRYFWRTPTGSYRIFGTQMISGTGSKGPITMPRRMRASPSWSASGTFYLQSANNSITTGTLAGAWTTSLNVDTTWLDFTGAVPSTTIGDLVFVGTYGSSYLEADAEI